MKSYSVRLFSIALLAFFLQGSVKSCGLFYLGEISLDQTFEVPNPVTISIESSGGSVKVEHGSEGKISITMKFNVRTGDRAGAVKLLQRLKEDPPVIRGGDKVRLGELDQYTLPTGGFLSSSISIDVEIKVPDGTTLDIQTNSGDLSVSRLKGRLKADLNGGSASVKNFEGKLDLATAYGRFELAHVRGETKLESANGSVFIRDLRGDLTVFTKKALIELDSEISSGARWHIETDSGDISVVLPHDANFLIYARTKSGQIKMDFPVTTTGLRGEWGLAGQVGPKTDTRVEIATQSGKIEIGRK